MPETLKGGWPTGPPGWTAGSGDYPSPCHGGDGDFDWPSARPRLLDSDHHRSPGVSGAAHGRSRSHYQPCAPPLKGG